MPGYQSGWLMMSDVCKHCANAPCMEACPTGALFRTEFDTVVGMRIARERHSLDVVFEQTRWGKVHRLGQFLSRELPLSCYLLDALRGASRRRSNVAALGVQADP